MNMVDEGSIPANKVSNKNKKGCSIGKVTSRMNNESHENITIKKIMLTTIIILMTVLESTPKILRAYVLVVFLLYM